MRYLKKSIVAVVSILCVAASVFGIVHRQDIRDWLVLRNYTPDQRIVTLADNVTMTDLGRKYLYVHKPELLSKEAFQHNCESGEETIVLGCYIQYQGIYIFDVTDERLSGIREVTTAHEMLHAAYDRLSTKEKQEVNDMLQKAFAASTNERIKVTIESYRKKDPTIVTNELHSILGTEEITLTPELENYYRKYFNDRARLVAYSVQYEGEFTKRTNRIKSLEAELDVLRPKIDAAQGELSLQRSLLEAEKGRLDALLAAERIDEYNAAVTGFNQRVTAYNTAIKRVQELINTFNIKVQEHNNLALEQKELIQAIDTRVNTENLR